MEFDNPAAGGHWTSQHNSNSDFSGSETSSKKEKTILGSAKKKDKEKKREKEKETKYAHLGDDSSNDDEDGGKGSSGKSKKKAFKIGLAKKEKKDKSKDAKEKDVENKESKEAKETKKKEKKEKPKLKLKKSKHTDSESDKNGKGDDTKWPPIFGVPLCLAVERNRCHDGIQLPVIVRECIDFIEENGLHVEGIYRSSGVKSKIAKLRLAYSTRQKVELTSAEPPVVASLLKLFLRELPDPVLTNKLIPTFEEVSKRKVPGQRLEGLRGLLNQLPEPNLRLVQWVFVHMGHVIQREKVNKMTLQNVSIVLSPTMQISHRVLNCIFEHAKDLFSGVSLIKYVPPISGPTVPLPESPGGIAEEMKKQESLLAELHQEISSGLVVSRAREEQLWEQQRIVTQLKRNLRIAKSRQEEEPKTAEPIVYEEELNFALQTPLTPRGEVDVKKEAVQTETNPDVKEKILPSILSSPDDGSTRNQEKIIVQVHQERNLDALKGEVNTNVDVAKDASKNHVTVIQLNRSDEQAQEETVCDNKTNKTNQTSIPVETSALPICKPRQIETIPAKDVVDTSPKDSGTTISKEENTTGIKNVQPPSKEVTPQREESTEEEKVREKVTFSSTGLPSSRNSSVPTAIPLLPPPPPSSKASSRGPPPSRNLAPPEQRLKSKSLPRGLPSEGVFDQFEESSEKISPEEVRREALLLEEMRLRFEFEELMNLRSELERRKKTERREIAELQEEIATMQTLYQYRTYSVDSSEDSSDEEGGVRGQQQRSERLALLRRLAKEKKELEQKKLDMQARLQEERAACLQLRVNIRMEQERLKRRGVN